MPGYASRHFCQARRRFCIQGLAICGRSRTWLTRVWSRESSSRKNSSNKRRCCGWAVVRSRKFTQFQLAEVSEEIGMATKKKSSKPVKKAAKKGTPAKKVAKKAAKKVAPAKKSAKKSRRRRRLSRRPPKSPLPRRRAARSAREELSLVATRFQEEHSPAAGRLRQERSLAVQHRREPNLRFRQELSLPCLPRSVRPTSTTSGTTRSMNPSRKVRRR